MSEYDNPDQFAANISRTLRDNPQWLSYALSGVTSGLERALAKQRERANDAEFALICALMLGNKTRLTEELKQTFAAKILKAIPLEHASLAEREAYLRYYEMIHGKPPE